MNTVTDLQRKNLSILCELFSIQDIDEETFLYFSKRIKIESVVERLKFYQQLLKDFNTNWLADLREYPNFFQEIEDYLKVQADWERACRREWQWNTAITVPLAVIQATIALAAILFASLFLAMLFLEALLLTSPITGLIILSSTLFLLWKATDSLLGSLDYLLKNSTSLYTHKAISPKNIQAITRVLKTVLNIPSLVKLKNHQHIMKNMTMFGGPAGATAIQALGQAKKLTQKNLDNILDLQSICSEIPPDSRGKIASLYTKELVGNQDTLQIASAPPDHSQISSNCQMFQKADDAPPPYQESEYKRQSACTPILYSCLTG
jgi:hypothetical protein